MIENTSRSRKVSVLIVDDRPDGLIALEAVLSDQRTEVIKANSGMEALRLLPGHEFAVILLDVQMPIMDGFETAAHIRSLEAYRHVPVIFVTAINKDDKYLYRGYESGAVDYVFKPFDPQILRSKVSIFIDLFLQSRKIRDQEVRLVNAERSERIRQLAELEVESLRRYRNLADSIPHIVLRTRPDSSPEYFNQVWSEYTGLCVEASVGEGWHRVMHPDDLPSLLRRWLDALIDGVEFEAECRIRRSDKTYRWHLFRVVPERSSSGEVVGWTGTATDIHDRKLHETELRRAMTEAESANVAKTQFLANMSHEIRTPLSAILGFSDLLLNAVQSQEERQQGVAAIRRNGEQLLYLINEILDISKVESGKIEIENLKVDVAALLGELSSTFTLKASEKSLSFDIEILNQVPKFVWTDPTRLRQIAINILSNAVKFTAAGSVRLQLGFSQNPLEPERGQLRFFVKDTGIGIPSLRVDRLFQPFMQADSSTTRQFGGTGLGLALSKKLAQIMGGDVRLNRSSESGSEFECWISCRVELATTLPVGKFRTELATLDVRDAQTTTARLDGLQILLVDDAPDNQVLISRFLRMAGANVEIAGNGKEGVEKAGRGSFDAVLMDIQMPIMDGYTAAGALRGQPGGFHAPLIALTAHALNTERLRCLEAGFDDHLSKPIDKINLVRCVRDWVEKKREAPTPQVFHREIKSTLGLV